jgi:hypothetical protein
MSNSKGKHAYDTGDIRSALQGSKPRINCFYYSRL